MDAIFWLAVANAIVWIGLGAYLSLLAIKQRQLAQRLKNLEFEDVASE